MADVTNKVATIRNAVYGNEVREGIASGIENINTEVISTTAKQTAQEIAYNSLIINAGNSNAEIVDARLGEATLKAKLEKVDTSLAEITQLINASMTLQEIQELLNKSGNFKFLRGNYNLGYRLINSYPVCLDIQDNTKINFEKGAIINLIPMIGTHYKILNIDNKSNIEIDGGVIVGDRYAHLDIISNKPWKMWLPLTTYNLNDVVFAYEKGYKCIVAGTTGTTRPTHTSGNVIDGSVRWEFYNANVGEWGIGVGVKNSENIILKNIISKNCWGDGFGVSGSNITLENCLGDNNRRQGVSVGSIENLVIKDSYFNNTNGTLPEAGIDIEPNLGSDKLKNILIENCNNNNNLGSGLEINILSLACRVGIPGEVKILIDKCSFDGNLRGLTYVCSNSLPQLNTVSGLIRVTNCVAKNSRYGISLYNIKYKTMPKFEADTIDLYSWTDYAIHSTTDILDDGANSENIVEYGGFDLKNINLLNPPLTTTVSPKCAILFNPSTNKKINATLKNIYSEDSMSSETLYWSAGDGTVAYKQPKTTSLSSVDGNSYKATSGDITLLLDTVFSLPKASLHKNREFTLIHQGQSNAFRLGLTDATDKIVGVDNSVVGLATLIITNGTKITLKSDGIDTWYAIFTTGDLLPMGYTKTRRMFYGSNYPSSGTWDRGDIVFFINATAGMPLGWICTVSGTSGTWDTLGITGTLQIAQQVNSTANDIATLKNDFNNLLAKIRASRLM